jgi:hypothetical protein
VYSHLRLTGDGVRRITIHPLAGLMTPFSRGGDVRVKRGFLLAVEFR